MTFMGLPVHALILHVTVVFVPLAALGGIVVSLWRWALDRYGVLVLAAGVVALGATILTQESGEALYNSFPVHSPAMDAHKALASPVLWWVIGMTVGQVVLMTGWFLGRRRHPAARILHWVGAPLSVAFGLASIVVVIRAGHAGSVAVWGGS